jgi:hypothetical protein
MRLLGSIEIIRDCRLERENAEDDTIGYVVPASSPLILPTPLHIPDSSRHHRLLLQIEEEVFLDKIEEEVRRREEVRPVQGGGVVSMETIGL